MRLILEGFFDIVVNINKTVRPEKMDETRFEQLNEER